MRILEEVGQKNIHKLGTVECERNPQSFVLDVSEVFDAAVYHWQSKDHPGSR